MHRLPRPQNGSKMAKLHNLHARRLGTLSGRASEDLLRNAWRGFVSATLPDGTILRDEPALRALIAESAVSR